MEDDITNKNQPQTSSFETRNQKTNDKQRRSSSNNRMKIKRKPPPKRLKGKKISIAVPVESDGKINSIPETKQSIKKNFDSTSQNNNTGHIDENDSQIDAIEEEVNSTSVLTKQAEPEQLPITLQIDETSELHNTQELILDNNNKKNAKYNKIEQLRKPSYNILI